METESTLTGRARPGCRWAWVLLLAVLALYGAAQVFVRTGLFRAQVEARLSQLAGMEVQVGRIRATASLNLRIRDVLAVTDRAGFEARLVRIRWRFFRPKGAPMLESVRVDGVSLTAAPGADGVMQPAFLGRLPGKWLGQAGLLVPAEPAAAAGPEAQARADAGSPALGLPVPRLALNGVSLRLLDAQGRLQVAAAGLDANVTTMTLADGRRVEHVGCRAAELLLVGRQRIIGLQFELIEAAGQRFLLGLEALDWGGAKPAGMESVELLRSLE